MNYLEYKPIPGYENYGVTKYGDVQHIPTGKNVNTYLIRGEWGHYRSFDVVECKTTTLSVHRAVALAWVPNDDPATKTVVNHLDGITTHNTWTNLEWTTYSGNNYHAVNTGLRPDNIRCKIRNFETGEIIEFPSMAQAAEHMGLKKDAPSSMLLKKKYGALISDRYEFKFCDDDTPWFYETRENKVAARFMVIVTDKEGNKKEIFHGRNLLKEYQLYDSPYGKSIPGLVKYAMEKYPDLLFCLKDSYTEERYRIYRNGSLSKPMGVIAEKDEELLEFSSLTKAATHFKVDRKSITRRLNTDIDLNGWLLKQGHLSGDI